MFGQNLFAKKHVGRRDRSPTSWGSCGHLFQLLSLRSNAALRISSSAAGHVRVLMAEMQEMGMEMMPAGGCFSLVFPVFFHRPPRPEVQSLDHFLRPKIEFASCPPLRAGVCQLLAPTHVCIWLEMNFCFISGKSSFLSN